MKRSGKRRWWWLVLAVLLLAGGGAAGWRWLRGPRMAAAVGVARVRSHQPTALARTLGEVAAVSAGPLRAAAVPVRARTAEVVLTFDDGPDHVLTPQVLDLLAAHRMRAVFFINGKNLVGGSPSAVARRALLRRAHAEGHLIGNHTYSHQHLCAIPEARGAEEIDRNEKEIEKLIGSRSVLFRSPYGDRCKRLSKLLGERGIAHTHWDIDPQEWKTHDAELTFKTVTSQIARAQGRVIVLMHDIQPATVAALPRILDWIDAEIAARAPKAAAAERPPALGVLRGHAKSKAALGGIALRVADPEVLLPARELPSLIALAAPLAALASAAP